MFLQNFHPSNPKAGPVWGDERHPRTTKNCFQGLGFPIKNARTFCIRHGNIFHSIPCLFLYYDIVSRVLWEDVPLLPRSFAKHSPPHPPSTHTQMPAPVAQTSTLSRMDFSVLILKTHSSQCRGENSLKSRLCLFLGPHRALASSFVKRKG